MAMKLYFAPGACSFVPHSLLETAGADYEPVMVKLHKGEQNEPAFRAVNPRGQVPVLVDGDQTITQIVAIVTYLDAKFPEQQYLPKDPLARAKVLETLAWMNNTVHPTFTHVFMPFKFAGTPEAQEELKSFNAKVYAGLLGEIEAMAKKAADAGKPWLGGDKLGPLDVYSLTLLRWGGFAKIDPASFPALWAHVQKVAQQPGVAKAVERERLQLNLFKA
ncbi:glutathione S-transferase family protein [Ramlibacter sp. USB13]|uniref:Glutathione S-transferase family protein n=1 Tax=Ramlibacter cellulosilyticus TaxID=2764187 RepID=A0A923MPB6_9BURK|nr:glutathione S-transferase family protein [Ramlibacter cellulosilyticus]MBC5782768.1 glutathione S-transferase family protein [Ramlibacter cellulosilyticus]